MLTFMQYIQLDEEDFKPGGPMYIYGHEKTYNQSQKWANNNRQVARRNVNGLANTPQRKNVQNDPVIKKFGHAVVKAEGGGVFPSKEAALANLGKKRAFAVYKLKTPYDPKLTKPAKVSGLPPAHVLTTALPIGRKVHSPASIKARKALST
jgi:hypothetical protein